MEDKVIRELDVYITDDPPILSLLQFPLRPVYADTIEVEAAQLKPRCKKLELVIPFGTSNFSEGDAPAGTELKQRYHSSIVAARSCLAAGVIKDNALHLSPIDSVLQLRPTFSTGNSSTLESGSATGETVDSATIEDELNEAGIDKKQGEQGADGGAFAAGASGIQQVQLRRKESERAQSLRLQSYSYLQSQEDQEPWVTLDVHDIGK